jgi:hypothetical protein
VVCHLNFPINIVGIARCFTYGGSKNSALHDPNVLPRDNLSKEKYMSKEEKQTSINHFHEKLFKLKDMMKTEVRAELWLEVPFLLPCAGRKHCHFQLIGLSKGS